MRPLLYWLLILQPIAVIADTHRQVAFSPPSGWTRQASGTFVTYTGISGNSFCQLAVYDDQSAQPALEASFASEWTGIFSRTFVAGAVPSASRQATPAGYEFAVGEAGIADRNGNRFHARLAAFSLPSQRVQSLVWISNS